MNLQKRVRARKDEEDSDELELPESESEFESVSGTEAGSSDAGDGNLEDTAEPQSGNDGVYGSEISSHIPCFLQILINV